MQTSTNLRKGSNQLAKSISFSIILIVAFLIPYVIANWDPYEVIGVRRDASLDQIKKAYRELARKLHPDKSNLNEDDAGRKFIELNKAFNILKDPDKRSRYDQHGETEDNRHSRGYSQQYHYRQAREYRNQNGYRTFTFYSSTDSFLRRKSITTRQYYNNYLKESKTKLFFVFFFSDFCPSCNIIEGTWTKITDELAKYNIGSFTVNVHHEPRLAQELGITSIPHIACLIDGQMKSYHQTELSLSNIVKFARNLLPNNLVKLLTTEEEQDRFISLGPQQNKLSAIIIHNENNLKLRYLLLAFELRQYYRFGHISTKLSQYKSIIDHYKITLESDKQTNFLVFNENIEKPTFAINSGLDDIDTKQLKDQLYKWPFLQLPRLSSQQKFDDLCLYAIPKDGSKIVKRLCVILFATDTPSTQPMRRKLIEFIEINNLARNNRVVFSFMDPLKQHEFVSSLMLETKNTYPFVSKTNETIDFAILTIERHGQHNRKAIHRWLEHRWDSRNPDEIDKAKLKLYDLISYYKRGSLDKMDKVAINLLIDEDGQSLIDRVFWRLVDHILRSFYYITSQESFSTIVILVICALITSLLIYQSPTSSHMRSSFMYADNEVLKDDHNTPQQVPQRVSQPLTDSMNIIELKAETYNGMVRLLKPGYRSIVLLADVETNDKLLTEFRKAVWPYRRNKTLLFGYLCLDKNLDWYRALLQEVLGVTDLNVNKKNCIGTVLSLNGFKKYFRVYHAKHHEIDYYDDETDNNGSFLGFNDDDEDMENGMMHSNSDMSRSDTVYTVENLLDRLPIWLDKMFDGLTKRYFLDNWPEEIH